MTSGLSPFRIGPVEVGGPEGIFLIAGPCVLENERRTLVIAERAAAAARLHGVGFVFKSSFDKANRSSIQNYRGPGLEVGLSWLARAKEELHVPVLVDVHEVSQVGPAAEVADCLQIPAFLCRQTDILVAAARSGRAVNIKKGQFMAPWDMENAVDKVRDSGCERVLVTERGFSFGYNNLVVDFRSLPILSRVAHVVFDGTHSVQLPGGQGKASGGNREMVEPLVRAAVAVGCSGLFLEVHDDPDHSPSDG
ncbi:MAG: 3-deoxy-8-phosphooctulonate synthase, partial [Planctomycetes bacterium]|nr:3-deoxy-8-phosphooctulonate synthase [Planctomycetota bacterium]